MTLQPIDLTRHREEALLDEGEVLRQFLRAEPSILAVDIRGDGHQILHEPRFEADQAVEGLTERRGDVGGRLRQRARGRRVSIQVVDQRGVERLLRLERRTDETPDEAREDVPARCDRSQPAPRVRMRQRLIEIGQARGIVRRRRLGQRRRLLHRVIDRRQRVVVDAVGVETFVLEAGQQILKRLFDHRSRI